MKKTLLIISLSLASFIFMPMSINQSHAFEYGFNSDDEETETLKRPKVEDKGDVENDDDDFRTMLEIGDKIAMDEIYSILNPEVENEASIKARNDFLHPKRNDQVKRNSEDDDKQKNPKFKTFNKNWIALDWEAKRNFMKMESGGVDAVTESLINFTIDLAIKQTAIFISKYSEDVGEKFEEIGMDIKNDTGGISRMVRLENADETRKQWYDAMFIDSHDVTINTIGQQLIDAVKRVGIKMVKQEIGGSKGQLAAKLLQDAAF